MRTKSIDPVATVRPQTAVAPRVGPEPHAGQVARSKAHAMHQRSTPKALRFEVPHVIEPQAAASTRFSAACSFCMVASKSARRSRFSSTTSGGALATKLSLASLASTLLDLGLRLLDLARQARALAPHVDHAGQRQRGRRLADARSAPQPLGARLGKRDAHRAAPAA